MTLLRTGRFKLSSGAQSHFRIDCDGFTDEDWKTAATLLAERLPNFSSVVGVPPGGLRLAQALRRYVSSDPGAVPLACGDVLTTGKSLLAQMEKLGRGSAGAVVFARGPCPPGVTALFQMSR